VGPGFDVGIVEGRGLDLAEAIALALASVATMVNASA
jgi:hypothetical protein